jgi:hypothetical protein
MPDSKRDYFDEFPLDEEEELEGGELQLNIDGQDGSRRENRLLLVWEGLSRAGLGETIFRLGTQLLSVALILAVIWGLREFYLYVQSANSPAPSGGVLAAAAPSPTPTAELPRLPVFEVSQVDFLGGIPRLVEMHTTIPTRPRTEIITYTVQKDDTIFGIAEKFGLIPQTILWGNYYSLADDPHNLTIGMALNIMPMNGTYHRWSAGEGLNGVASGYNVTPDVIISWEGNHLNPDTLGDWSNPNIEPGTMLFVPGGERSFVTWSAPFIGRENPTTAKILGPGACGMIVDGAVGTGSFIWPSNSHYVGGYQYSPSTNHFGIDLSGSLGDAIYAADNGVVVYAGWNNWGYGNVVVIDHAGGWQTLYAHLSVIGVGCGQSVYQGSVIGAYGSTGNSSGPHLHFEMLHESYGKVNPLDFLP